MKAKREPIFFLTILLVGLLTIFSYGAYLDQESEQRILLANIKEYLIQLPGENPPLVQQLTDSGVVEISIDEDRDHGMAVYYPAFFIWYLRQASPYWGSVFWHTYTFLLIFWGMVSLYRLGKELFHRQGIAMFTVLLFFLSPRMFAESHYNNKDVVLLSLCFTLFYWAWKLMRELSWKSVWMFALVGALAFNMKLIGGWVFGALGIYAVIYLAATKRYNGQAVKKTAACIGIWAGSYLLLTPACWTDFVGFFQYLIGYAVNYDLWHDSILFDGRMLQKDLTGMPRKYLPVLILLTTPIGILLLVAGGAILALYHWIVSPKRNEKRLTSESCYVLVILLTALFPLGFAVVSATPVYNGWRHFYFVYAAMTVAAGYCSSWIYEKAVGLKQKKGGKIVAAAGICYLVFLAAGIAWNYPQEHSYYNALAGKEVVSRYELDYWDMSVKQAYEAILKDTEEKDISVGALNYPTLWGLDGQKKVLPRKGRSRITVAENWQDAEYLIINTTYAVMYSADQYQQVKTSYEQVAGFTSYGNVICEVWKRK